MRDPVAHRAAASRYAKSPKGKAARAKRAATPEGLLEHRRRQFRYLYGLDYDATLERRQGPCDICGQPETVRRARSADCKLLTVDHDHTSGRVRGFLCARCNVAIGHFREDPTLLANAILYLEVHRAA